MNLINFFIKKYNLKNFFLFEIKIIKNFYSLVSRFFVKYIKYIIFFYKLIEFLFFFYFFLRSFSIYIVLFYFIYLKFRIFLVKLSEKKFKLFVFIKNFFINRFTMFLLYLRFYYRKYLFFLQKVSLILLKFKLLLYKTLGKFNFFKFCNYFVNFFLVIDNFIVEETKFFLIKFFFNFFNSIDVNYFIFLTKNFINYYTFNNIFSVHRWLMSIPEYDTWHGTVNFSWLMYCAPVTVLSKLPRWSYNFDLDERFETRYYYREKMVFSYFKNFVTVFINFFFLGLKAAEVFIISFFARVKILSKSFFFSVYLINKKLRFKFIPVLTKWLPFILCFFLFFFVVVVFNYSVFKVALIVAFRALNKWGRRLVFLLPYPKRLYSATKKKIWDRVSYLFRNISFGIGDRFKRRYTYLDFFHIVYIFFWVRKKFTRRKTFFRLYKRTISRKRIEPFRLFFKLLFRYSFKLLFFLIKYFFIFLKVIVLYLLSWCYYLIIKFFFADLCFVL